MTQLDKFSARILRANGQPAHEDDKGRVPLRDGTVYKISLKNYHDRDAAAEITIDGRSVGVYLVKAKSKLVVDSPLVGDGKFTFFKVSSGPGAELMDTDQTDVDLGLIRVTFTLLKKNLDKKSIENLLEDIKRALEEQNKRPINVTIENTYPSAYDQNTHPSVYPLRIWCETHPIVYTVSTQKCPTTYPETAKNTTISHFPSISTINNTSSMDDLIVVYCSTTETLGSDVGKRYSPEPGITGLTGESDKFYEEAPKDMELFDEDSTRVLYLRLIASDEEVKEYPRKLVKSTPIPPPIGK
jgi:hypothetical protein